MPAFGPASSRDRALWVGAPWPCSGVEIRVRPGAASPAMAGLYTPMVRPMISFMISFVPP